MFAIKKERGISLLEVLVSIFILTIATLALLHVQMASLANASDAVYRSQAIRLIEDLSERVKSNPLGVQAYPSFKSGFSKAAPNFTACTQNCRGEQLAQSDRDDFLSQVHRQLPGGQAAIFTSTTDAQQLGVMVGWTESKLTSQSPVNGIDALAIAPALTPAGIACPNTLRCHLVYLQAQ